MSLCYAVSAGFIVHFTWTERRMCKEFLFSIYLKMVFIKSNMADVGIGCFQKRLLNCASNRTLNPPPPSPPIEVES